MTIPTIVFTGLVLRNETRDKVLLLLRNPTKNFHPNLYSCIGGKQEAGETVKQTLDRENRQEVPQLNWSTDVTDIRRHLVLENWFTTKDGTQEYHVMHWHTGILRVGLTDFSSTEGTLHWFPAKALPLPKSQMTPSAYAAIPFMLSLEEGDTMLYKAQLDQSGEAPRLAFTH